MSGCTKELVNTNTVADYYGVNRETVRRWTRTGLIPHVRITRRTVRYRLSDVERALRSMDNNHSRTQ